MPYELVVMKKSKKSLKLNVAFGLGIAFMLAAAQASLLYSPNVQYITIYI